jgi:Protein of unknown function (DUF3263)
MRSTLDAVREPTNRQKQDRPSEPRARPLAIPDVLREVLKFELEWRDRPSDDKGAAIRERFGLTSVAYRKRLGIALEHRAVAQEFPGLVRGLGHAGRNRDPLPPRDPASDRPVRE